MRSCFVIDIFTGGKCRRADLNEINLINYYYTTFYLFYQVSFEVFLVVVLFFYYIIIYFNYFFLIIIGTMFTFSLFTVRII